MFILIKKSILNLIEEIITLQNKQVLEIKQEEIVKLFNEIQDTDDIYRYYENLGKIKEIVYLSSLDNENNKVDLKDILGFERFNKLKQELENKQDKLENILDYDVKNTINIFVDVMNNLIDLLSEIEELKKFIWNTKRIFKKSDYVITIDRIIKNGGKENFIKSLITDKQIDEWKELGFIDDKIDINKIDFENSKLPIDTKYLNEEQKYRLLSLFNNIEEQLDGNIFKSENYQALNTILNKYKEKIKTIYIDPPYNTLKNGFVYKDNYKHGTWLSMMYDRLKLAKNLMTDDGVIFSSIDNNEVDNLKKLKDMVFGSENFVSNLIWKKSYTIKNDIKTIANQTEYIYCYIKHLKAVFNRKKIDEDYIKKTYRYKDEKGIFMTVQLYKKKNNKTFEVVSPTGKKWKRGWNYNQEGWKELEKNNLIYWGEDGNACPRKKVYLKDNKGQPFGNYLPEKEVGYTGDGGNYLEKLGFLKTIFLYSKPYTLIKYLLTINTKYNQNNFILDFFPGSGTTADAVIRLNVEDGGNRKFILTELNNYFDTIIIPRIKKVAYSLNWKDGKPQDNGGPGIFFKYSYLEQYDEILEKLDLNIELKTFQEKLLYLYKQILLDKLKDNDFAETILNHLGLKAIKYHYLDKDNIVLETDKLNIIVKGNKALNNGKDNYGIVNNLEHSKNIKDIKSLFIKI